MVFKNIQNEMLLLMDKNLAKLTSVVQDILFFIIIFTLNSEFYPLYKLFQESIIGSLNVFQIWEEDNLL